MIIKLLLSALGVGLGVFLFVYGGYDDSPGAQGLGALLAIGSIVLAVRKSKQR